MKQPFTHLLILLVFLSFLCLGESGNRIQGKTNKVKYNSKWWENGRKSYGSCSAKPTETKDCRAADNPTSSGIASEWQEWGGWSECSSSCGRGLKIRARACNGSQRSCQGESAETKECLISVCPGHSLCILLYSFFTLFRICQAKWVARMEWMVQVLQLMWQGVENQGSSLQRKTRLMSRRAHRNQRLLYGWVSRFQQLSFPCTAILNTNSILNKACPFLWCGVNVNIPSLISKSNTTQCKIWSAVVISANIDYKRYASNVSMKMTMLTIFLPWSFKP